MTDSEKGSWITIGGRHIQIGGEGQPANAKDAIASMKSGKSKGADFKPYEAEGWREHQEMHNNTRKEMGLGDKQHLFSYQDKKSGVMLHQAYNSENGSSRIQLRSPDNKKVLMDHSTGPAGQERLKGEKSEQHFKDVAEASNRFLASNYKKKD